MNRPRHFVFALTVALVCMAATLHGSTAGAAWNAGGNPVCTVAGTQENPVACSDGLGGMIVVWVDWRTDPVSVPNLYAQRMSSDGSRAWPTNGVKIGPTNGAATIVADGGGGALVLWPASGALRALDLTASGAVAAGWPAAGRVLGPTAFNENVASYTIADDGTIDLLTVEHPDATNTRLRLWRVGQDGLLLPSWPAPVVVTTGIQGFSGFILGMLARSASGTIWVGYTDWYDGGIGPNYYQGKLKAFGATGTPLLTKDLTPAGTTVVNVTGLGSAADDVLTLSPTLDRFNLAGAPQWSPTPSVPFSDRFLGDGSGGVWLARLNPGGIFRLDANGTSPAGFGTGGVALAGNSLFDVRLAREGADLWISRAVGTASESDLYVTKVKADGAFATGFDATGVRMTATSGVEANGSQPVPTGTGAALVAWSDPRVPTEINLYAGLAAPAPPLGAPNAPPPAGGLRASLSARFTGAGSLEVRFATLEHADVSLELLDVSGRALAECEVTAVPGAWQTAPLPADALANGIYWVRARQGGVSAATRVSVLR